METLPATVSPELYKDALNENLLITVCCVCDSVMGTKPKGAAKLSGNLTHGYCDPCGIRTMAEFKQGIREINEKKGATT